MNHDLLHELEKKIGYKFQKRELIINAMTHSSFSNEEKAKGRHADSNERMEFLGDAILSIIVSTYLFDNFALAQEGELSKIRSAVVCEKALASYAEEIELGKYLLLGHGEEINNGRERPSILSDAYEALLAAIYLDAGENAKETVAKFLLPFIVEEINSARRFVFAHSSTALSTVLSMVLLMC